MAAVAYTRQKDYVRGVRREEEKDTLHLQLYLHVDNLVAEWSLLIFSTVLSNILRVLSCPTLQKYVLSRESTALVLPLSRVC